MKLAILTIVKNGAPYIKEHLSVFEHSGLDWSWHLSEGQAANVACTTWCRPMPTGFSSDGTHEYLLSLASNPRVKIHCKKFWPGGKLEMCNDALTQIKEPCVLLQVDADESWTSNQLKRIVELFESQPNVTHAYFLCRYFVGPDIITTGINCYGNQSTEWLRAWRFTPGQRFITHEPPNLAGNCGNAFHRLFTAEEKLIFDHFAWATKEQVAYKQAFYGYQSAVSQWERLQANTNWPVPHLKDYLSWVDDRVGADKLQRIEDSK